MTHTPRPSQLSFLVSIALATAACQQDADMGPGRGFGMDPLPPSTAGDSEGGGTDGETDETAGSTGDDASTGGTGGATGSTGGPAPVCGDGVVDPGEACDDGNDQPGDGCEPDCTLTPACGDGVFQAGEICHAFGDAPDVGGSAAGVAIADLDGDGDADLVASMPADDRLLRVLYEAGAPADETEFATVAQPRRIEAHDVDADGAFDLLVETPDNSGMILSLISNNGTGSLTQSGLKIVNTNDPHAFGHFDDDDALDAVIVSGSLNFPNVTGTYTNIAANGTSTAIHAWVWQPETPTGLAAADINGDGRDDLVAPLPYPAGVQIQMMDAAGVPGAVTTLNQFGLFDDFFLTDLSGDGVPDIVSPFPTQPKVLIVRLRDDGSFDGIAYAQAPDILAEVVAGDFDGDGWTDLVAATNSQELVFLHNLGNNEFEQAHSLVLGDVPEQMAAGDLNGDGRDDVALALPNFGEVRLALSAP